VILARAAGALHEVVFEVRVAARDLGDPAPPPPPRAARGPRLVWTTMPVALSTPCSRGRLRVGQLRPEQRGKVSRIGSGPDLLPCPVDHRPRRVHRERVAGLARELVHRGRSRSSMSPNATARPLFPGAWGLARPSPARKASSTVSSAMCGSSVRVRSVRSSARPSRRRARCGAPTRAAASSTPRPSARPGSASPCPSGSARAPRTARRPCRSRREDAEPLGRLHEHRLAA